jgi:hypothetical protein
MLMAIAFAAACLSPAWAIWKSSLISFVQSIAVVVLALIVFYIGLLRKQHRAFSLAVRKAYATLLYFVAGLLLLLLFMAFRGGLDTLAWLQSFGPLGLSMGLVAALLLYSIVNGMLNHARSLASPRATELLQEDTRQPVLFLRSFADEHLGRGNPDKDLLVLLALLFEPLTGDGYVQQPAPSFEAIVQRLFRKVGPIITIGIPGERNPPPGAARLWVSDSEWQGKVEELLQQCQRVVLSVGRTTGKDGLAWEVRKVFTLQTPEKLVILAPPLPETVIAERWNTIAELSEGRLPWYQPRYLVATFSPGWRFKHEGPALTVSTGPSRPLLSKNGPILSAPAGRPQVKRQGPRPKRKRAGRVQHPAGPVPFSQFPHLFSCIRRIPRLPSSQSFSSTGSAAGSPEPNTGTDALRRRRETGR